MFKWFSQKQNKNLLKITRLLLHYHTTTLSVQWLHTADIVFQFLLLMTNGSSVRLTKTQKLQKRERIGNGWHFTFRGGVDQHWHWFKSDLAGTPERHSRAHMGLIQCFNATLGKNSDSESCWVLTRQDLGNNSQNQLLHIQCWLFTTLSKGTRGSEVLLFSPHLNHRQGCKFKSIDPCTTIGFLEELH